MYGNVVGQFEGHIIPFELHPYLKSTSLHNDKIAFLLHENCVVLPSKIDKNIKTIIIKTYFYIIV